MSQPTLGTPVVTLYEKLRDLTREDDQGAEREAALAVPRLLILGTKVASREVTSHEWHDIPDSVNMTDFDAIVLNYAVLADDELQQRIKRDRLPDPDQMIRHFFHEDSVTIVIGPPRSIGTYENNPGGPLSPQWFFPFKIRFASEHGTAIEKVSPGFEPYFETVDRWSWYVTSRYQRSDGDLHYIANVVAVQEPTDVQVEVMSVATNAKDESIGFMLRAGLVSDLAGPRGEPGVLAKSGHLFWLPEPTTTTDEEAIEILLASFFGIRLDPPGEPPWLLDYTLPDEETVDARIEAIRGDIRTKQNELASAIDERERIRRFHPILYDRGESLEPPVRDALRILGADVRDPEDRGGNDGMLQWRGRRAVLEIKGHRGVVTRNDVRQLHDWVADAEQDPDWDGKGILVGNPHCGSPPDQREDPFDANAVEVAERWDISLITSTQVFRALQDQQAGDVDEHAFWTAIFDNNGAIDLLDLDPQGDVD